MWPQGKGRACLLHCTYVTVCTWRSEGKVWEGVCSLPPCGSGEGLRLGGESLYLLSHLGPLTFLLGFCFETVFALNAQWSSISAYQLLARRLRHQAALRKHRFSRTVPPALEPGIFFSRTIYNVCSQKSLFKIWNFFSLNFPHFSQECKWAG